MKNIKLIPALILLIVFINSCDYVTPTKSTTTKIVDTATYITKVLVEDYTGHGCGNCPYAAYQLDTLLNQYGSQIVPIAVHAGYFADTNAFGANFKTNFNTSVGTDWDNFFGMSLYGNPIGMIDRTGYSGSQYQLYTAWGGSIGVLAATKPAMTIKISNSYNSTTRTINDSIICTYLQALDSTYKLSVLITEDSIINYQEEYINSGATLITIPNYVFNHVLRGSMNGSWGDTLSTGTQPAMATFTKVYTLGLGSLVNTSGAPNVLADKNCHVVAFIYNSATYEVIQAEEVWVTH
jgi:hypothetical protein